MVKGIFGNFKEGKEERKKVGLILIPIPFGLKLEGVKIGLLTLVKVGPSQGNNP